MKDKVAEVIWYEVKDGVEMRVIYAVAIAKAQLQHTKKQLLDLMGE